MNYKLGLISLLAVSMFVGGVFYIVTQPTIEDDKDDTTVSDFNPRYSKQDYVIMKEMSVNELRLLKLGFSGEWIDD